MATLTIAEVRHVLDVIGSGIEALDQVGTTVEGFLSGTPTIDDAVTVLTGVAAVVKIVRSALSGNAQPVDVEAAIAEFGASLARNNAAIDVSVDAKFPKDP